MMSNLPNKKNTTELVHVFYLHSYVSTLIAKAIILREKIEQDRILIWKSRDRVNLLLDLPVAIRDLDEFPLRNMRIPKSLNLLKTWRRLRSLDADISESVGGKKYHLYIPHSYSQFFQFVATHDLCEGFSYLEEGLAAYRSNDEIVSKLSGWGNGPWSLRLPQRIILRSRIQGNCFYSRQARRVYGVLPESFRKLHVPCEKVEIKWKTDLSVADKYNNCALLLLAPLRPRYSKNSDPEGYIQALTKVAKVLLRSPFDRIYVRAHPESSASEFHGIFSDIFSSAGGRFYIDAGEYPVEAICASSSVTLIAAGSSASIYAESMGRKVLSFTSICSECSPLFKKQWEDIKSSMDLTYENVDIRDCSWAA